MNDPHLFNESALPAFTSSWKTNRWISSHTPSKTAANENVIASGNNSNVNIWKHVFLNIFVPKGRHLHNSSSVCKTLPGRLIFCLFVPKRFDREDPLLFICPFGVLQGGSSSFLKQSLTKKKRGNEEHSFSGELPQIRLQGMLFFSSLLPYRSLLTAGFNDMPLP